MMTEQTVNKTQLLAQFLSTGEEFISAVRELPEHTLDCSAAPGEWSIRQIVHHVSDDADLWSFALKKAIASPGAPMRFEGFPGNEPWAAALGFQTRSVKTALSLIQAHHQLMVEIATFALDQWEQAYIELYDDKGASLGKLPVAQIFQMLTGHMQEHLQTVRTILS